MVKPLASACLGLLIVLPAWTIGGVADEPDRRLTTRSAASATAVRAEAEGAPASCRSNGATSRRSSRFDVRSVTCLPYPSRRSATRTSRRSSRISRRSSRPGRGIRPCQMVLRMDRRGLISGAVLPTSAAGQDRAAPPVTFSADIAPILFERCGGCHRPQGAAPFSLLTYAAARQRASLIAQVTKARLMPPWKSEPGYGDFIGHVHLTDDEIDLIERWAAAGAPKEMRGICRRRRHGPTAGSSVVRPNGVVSGAVRRARRRTRFFPHLRPPPSGGCPTYVKGLEFRPGNAGVVHHANIRIDRDAGSRELDEQDPAPGYSGLLLVRQSIRMAIFSAGPPDRSRRSCRRAWPGA